MYIYFKKTKQWKKLTKEQENRLAKNAKIWSVLYFGGDFEVGLCFNEGEEGENVDNETMYNMLLPKLAPTTQMFLETTVLDSNVKKPAKFNFPIRTPQHSNIEMALDSIYNDPSPEKFTYYGSLLKQLVMICHGNDIDPWMMYQIQQILKYQIIHMNYEVDWNEEPREDPREDPPSPKKEKGGGGLFSFFLSNEED